jgi:hypothetical protein
VVVVVVDVDVDVVTTERDDADDDDDAVGCNDDDDCTCKPPSGETGEEMTWLDVVALDALVGAGTSTGAGGSWWDGERDGTRP